jgi:hypothetical protein
MKLVPLLIAFLAIPIGAARAIDPGTAQGVLRAGADQIALTHSFALLHDNAEKLLDRPAELRIVLADRDIPQDSLTGIAFLRVAEMAREGQLRGLLLQLDPDQRGLIVVTVLNRLADPRQSLMTQTLGATGQKVMKRLTIANNRVSGEIEHAESRAGTPELPQISYAVRFSAPLFHEPRVTADLQGKAAQDSPQARLLREKARALAKGDFDAVRKISTQRANTRNDAFLAQAGAQGEAFAKEAGAEMEKSFRKLKRVVVRGERAVAIFGEGEWMNFAREGGAWRVDD